MTATATIPSASVQAKAQQLLSERDRWTYARNTETGVAFIAVPSGDHVHQVHPTGRGCSCDAYQLGGLLCSHRLAVIEAAHEDSLAADDVMSAGEVDVEIMAMIAARPVTRLLKTYEQMDWGND